ncbi:hypothetical protein [Nocardia farcinica]|uniref:hypothetical protein n=1 Tax=Nocardia farcinica TaxID=37329 RepID=UPI0024590F02|nr:hypothetical protein [Nocardia farcinica]
MPATQLIPVLRRSGVKVAAGNDKELTLLLPGRKPRHVDLELLTRQVTQAVVERNRRRDRTVLFAAPSATRAVVASAKADQIDLVTYDPPTVIIAGHVLLEYSRHQRDSHLRHTPAWGSQAVLRILATTSTPLQQTELAAMSGITQQAVSHALTRARDLVTRTSEGWLARDGALRAWLEGYSGPGGTVTHWYGLDDPTAQAAIALALLDELDLTAVISGDLAADRYAPWQLPGTVHIYLPEIVDFTPAGFSPAQAADATLVTIVPQDPTVARVAAGSGRLYAGRHLLADPAITLWDLLNTSTTPTAHEAAQRLTAAITSGSLDA